MSKKEVKYNIRVEVEPRSPGDFGMISFGGVTRSENQTLQLCEEIADDIRRHVDNLPSGYDRGVRVVYDSEFVCSHCSSDWKPDQKGFNDCCLEHEDEFQKNNGKVVE